MVVNRSEYKRRRKDEPDVLQESPKRTKVHAQRKFAQGSSTVTSPTLTPVKDKVKVNGSVPPAELLPAKRPHTEDFLTFLCFRGTRILPPRLNFFNTASVTETLDDDVRSAAGSSRGNAKQNKNSEQIPNNSDVDRGRNTKKPASAQDRAAKALKKKYLEQRLAKQKKTCLTKLAETVVKDDRLSKTRSSARAAALEQKRKRNARIMAYNKARKAVITSPAKPAKPIVKREHNETLAKLNFVLAVSECVMEVAGGRPRSECLVLLVRALQLLSSGLTLATAKLRSKTLQPSSSVKNVVSQLNVRFRQCLSECKQLNSPGLLQNASATADKILYNHAIHMCQSAALDELFGNPAECFQRYQTAQILLHSLSQQVSHHQDRALLTKYKDAVEKRLSVLQQQGYVYVNNTST